MRLPLPAAPAAARRFGVTLAKRSLAQCLKPARRIGALPLARGKLSAADVFGGELAGLDADIFSRSFRVFEAPPPAKPGPPPPRPVATRHLVLDTDDPRFCCRNNHVTAPGNLVLYEDECAFDGMPVRLRLLERPRQVGGTLAYLSNTTPANYYHWLALCLPLIGVYRTRLGVEPDFYYVGRPLTPWHLETLARAGIAAEQVLTDAVTADRLVADIPSRDGAVDSAMLAFTRALFPAAAVTPFRRLFVGRGDAGHRRLLNERDCAELAARHGFDYVTLSGRSVAEQVRLFAEARYIVAPHGAALSNLLFTTPEAHLLELMPGDPFIPHVEGMPLLLGFREIAAFIGCGYRHLVGAAAADQHYRSPFEADFTVDLAAFRRALAALLEGAPPQAL
jgi:hypothetical protein